LLDDYDVLSTFKNWMAHKDKVLSLLCRCLVERRLLKVKFQAEPFENNYVKAMKEKIQKQLCITETEVSYFVFTGEAINTTYDTTEEHINILFKDGTIKDISKVDNALIQYNLSRPVKKFYICYYGS